MDVLKQMQNIILITEIIGGDFDVLAIAAVKDFKSIINLVIEIRKLLSVDQVEVSFTNDASFPVAKDFYELFLEKRSGYLTSTLTKCHIF